MADKVETYFAEGQWRNRVEGSDDVPDTFETKGQAAEQGRMIAMDRGVEHVIREQDGSIGERNVYPPQSDPRDPSV
jgi:hypothetical protein